MEYNSSWVVWPTIMWSLRETWARNHIFGVPYGEPKRFTSSSKGIDRKERKRSDDKHLPYSWNVPYIPFAHQPKFSQDFSASLPTFRFFLQLHQSFHCFQMNYLNKPFEFLYIPATIYQAKFLFCRIGSIGLGLIWPKQRSS